jgi:hypothetical protein
MMGGKSAKGIGVTAHHDHSAIGNLDTFPIEIHFSGRGATDGFFRTGSGEERTMKHREFRMPGWIWNCNGEEAGIFVIHVA